MVPPADAVAQILSVRPRKSKSSLAVHKSGKKEIRRCAYHIETETLSVVGFKSSQRNQMCNKGKEEGKVDLLQNEDSK